MGCEKKIVEQEIDWKIRKKKRINEYDVCVISSLMETAAKETEAVGRKKEVCISLDLFVSFARFPQCGIIIRLFKRV